MNLKCFLSVIILALGISHLTAQTTVHVTTNGAGDGSSWPDATNSIQGAINAAGAGGLVLVSNGTYIVTNSIQITEAVTVRGMNPPAGVSITRDPAYDTRIVNIANAGAVFDGFTITNGYAPASAGGYNGGGIHVTAGLVTNCNIFSNYASHRGGGIYLESVNAMAIDCRIMSNNVGAGTLGGGGAFLQQGAELRNCWIVTNKSVASGGGVFTLDLAGLTNIISNCRILDNELAGSSGYGGGVFVHSGQTLVTDSLVSNNSALAGIGGGGVGIRSAGHAILVNSQITHNKASLAGGGVHIMRSEPGKGAFISNCIISFNTVNSTYGGGGIMDGYPLSDNTSSGRLEVVDTEIIGNDGVQCGGGVFIYTHGTALFHNCEIRSNYLRSTGVDVYGGGMYIGTGSTYVVVQNCLIDGNYTLAGQSGGGGIIFSNYLGGVSASGVSLDARVESCTVVSNRAMNRGYGGMNVIPGNVTVWNTIIVSNAATAGTPQDIDDGVASIAAFHYSCSPVLTNASQGNITNTPVFMGFSGGDYRLRRDSPGINAGAYRAWMDAAVDLDGRSRIDRFSGVLDMGCYEHLPRGVLYRLR